MSIIDPLYMYRIAIASALFNEIRHHFHFLHAKLCYELATMWLLVKENNVFVRFEKDCIEKVPLPAILDSANCLVQYLVSSIFFLSNNYQNGQNVAVLA